jgi:hypothetical protein
LSLKGIFSEPESRQLMLRLAGEAIDVGKALGYAVEPVFGVAALTTLIKKMERGQACPGKESMGLLWAE